MGFSSENTAISPSLETDPGELLVPGTSSIRGSTHMWFVVDVPWLAALVVSVEVSGMEN